MVTDDRETSLAEVVPVAAQSLSRKPAAPQGGRYIPILDGWRGVAILFVLIFHGTYNTHFVPNSRMMHVSAIVGKLGILGVLIFFAISGYLITKKLMDETPAGSPIDLRAFFIKRVFRILPPLAVYLVVLLVLSLLGVITLAFLVPGAVGNNFNNLPGGAVDIGANGFSTMTNRFKSGGFDADESAAN